MDANLQSDFTTISGFLEKLMQAIEAAGSDNARSRLAEELLRHYKYQHTLEFRTIPAAYADEVVQTLTVAGVPHMASKNSAGDTVLILPPERDSHMEYGHLLDDIFMHYPEYYKQLAAKTWATLTRMDEEKEVVCFTFQNELDAEIFKNKIYADGRGVVTTDLSDEKSGVVRVYCRTSDFINNRSTTDAISAFIETEYSLHEGSQAFARRYAVYHDRKQAEEAYRMMKEGKAFVIHDGANKYADYLQYEDHVLTYYQYDSEQKKFSARAVDADTKDGDAIKKLFEYYMSRIHNEHISSLDEFQRDFEQHTENFIRDRYMDRQKDMYEKVIIPAMQRIARDGDGQETFYSIINDPEFARIIKEWKLEDIRPDFSVDFLEALRDDFAAKKDLWQGELLSLSSESKMEYEQLDSVLADRASNLKRDLSRRGFQTLGGRSIDAMSIPTLKKELSHKMKRQEAKLREMCGFTTKLSGNPRILLHSLSDRGIPIAHAKAAAALLEKKESELSREESELLCQIADDTLFDMCARESDAIASQVGDFYATRDALREVDDLLLLGGKLCEDRTKKYEDAMQKVSEKKRNVSDMSERIAYMDTLINNEKNRVLDIEQTSKKVHAHIEQCRKEHPDMKIGAVIGSQIFHADVRQCMMV